jgi:DNA-binding XRE family transcriptional regulator
LRDRRRSRSPRWRPPSQLRLSLHSGDIECGIRLVEQFHLDLADIGVHGQDIVGQVVVQDMPIAGIDLADLAQRSAEPPDDTASDLALPVPRGRNRFGANVRLLRTSKGLSQEAFAHACGLHRTYIGSIERGERNISLDNMERIAAALEKELPDLRRTAVGREATK